ncbi:MAG: hypothetical protein R2825_24605 [Saprospiraceae bacterium]
MGERKHPAVAIADPRKTQELHEYNMPMPKSWAAARQHFMDNLAKAEGERERLISKEAFFKRCEEDFKVRKEAIPSLLTLLHHNGVVAITMRNSYKTPSS